MEEEEFCGRHSTEMKFSCPDNQIAYKKCAFVFLPTEPFIYFSLPCIYHDLSILFPPGFVSVFVCASVCFCVCMLKNKM